MCYFAFYEPERFYGDRPPVPGARVCFDPERLFEARDCRTGRLADRHTAGGEGLVVHEVATDVLVWPSGLWRVGGLERPVRLRPGNRWVRCRAFTVVEEVPAWLVAGPHGDDVERVIARARVLTGLQAEALAALPEEGEEAVRQALWARWSELRRSGSPVGCGLTALNEALREAARAVGPHLFGWDEEDGVETLSDPVWLRAWRAAYGAALALGAPSLLAPEENAVLTRRWTTVFGRSGLSGVR